MYYRVAIQVAPLPLWQWKSTALSELSALFQWFRLYHALPQDRLRVFSSYFQEELNEQLARENQGLESTSVTALQFLRERKIGSSPEVEQGASDLRTSMTPAMAPNASTTTPSLQENSGITYTPFELGMSALERTRLKLEYGAGGDHDSVYTFTLPSSIAQFLVWLKLRAGIREGILQPELEASW